MSKVTMTRRFYLASPKMSNGLAEEKGWLRLLPEAIEEAKRAVSQECPECDVRYVVEVVAVVRREPVPVIVEMIRK